jgi:hypothetical protein
MIEQIQEGDVTPPPQKNRDIDLPNSNGKERNILRSLRKGSLFPKKHIVNMLSL